jgi:hypothetical protein
MENSKNVETLTKHYEILIEAYKHHLDFVLKVNIFYYAVTGAIVSYYLSQPNIGYMRFALALPILLSISLGAFAIFASRWIKPWGIELERVMEKLELKAAPSVSFLKLLLIISGSFFFIVAIGLSTLSIMRPWVTH